VGADRSTSEGLTTARPGIVLAVDEARAADLLGKARSNTEAALRRLRGEQGTPDDDQADASAEADNLVETGTDEALEGLLVRRLEAIEGAEARLREGTYGRSVASGETIPDGRLEIEPWAELTVTEQASG
jgi:DnaK suppressor protein